VQDSPFAAHNYAAFASDAQRTDVVVPFSYLGIDDPSATALKLVALASSDDHLNLWAAIPGPNPLNHPQVLNPALTDLVNTTPFTLTRWLTLQFLGGWAVLPDGRPVP
jgi:hypothetical protein